MWTDGAATAIVFSHPNHELAVFGLVQRLRPRLVFLTDGGGPARVAETHRALTTLGLADRAAFLGYPEGRFYDRLLARDHGFWRDVAGRLTEALTAAAPARVLCDAVEFYNPVHDLSLPLVRAALGDRPVPVFEVPLVYQDPAPVERYTVQRLPASRAAETLHLTLTPAEVASKLAARRDTYRSLAAQMGPILDALPESHLAREEIAPAPPDLPRCDGERVLRYEWRAARLRAQGAIDEAIGYTTHYLPVTDGLLRAAA